MSMMASAPSLRFRLVFGTLVMVTVIWVGVTVFAWRAAVHEAEELFDAHLAQTAALLVALSGDEPEEIAEHLPEHRYMHRVAFQVWQGPVLLVHSQGAPESPLALQASGFSNSPGGEGGWRVYSLEDAQTGYRVHVAEALRERGAISRELVWHLLLPLGIALPVLALALIVLIRRSLWPLSRLADSIGERSADCLDTIPMVGVFREMHPIIAQLNRLFVRLVHSFDKERRFTADAAHELRTPLAAIRAHAQVALAEADPVRRNSALTRVIEGTDRTTHLVEQLLTLARLDATQMVASFTLCDLRALAVEVVAQCAPAAIAKSIDLEVEEGGPVPMRGDVLLLSVLFRNLIDNAIRYSPPATRVVVALRDVPPGLAVMDQGPGIPAEDRERVVQRFVRLLGQDAGGAGLGLSIAARIAELHGARLLIDDRPQGGLAVRVDFPS